MAGPRQVGRQALWVNRLLNCPRPVMRGYASRDALSRIDRFAKSRAETRRIAARHHGQVQLVTAFAGQSQANQPSAVNRHEVDNFGSNVLGGQCEVSLILTIVIIYNDDHTPAAD